MTQTQVKNKIDINDLKRNDVFSEESHYAFIQSLGKNARGEEEFQFKHLESNQLVTLGASYVTDLLQTADQYETEVEVGIEDKFWTAKQIEAAKKKGEIPEDSTLREGDLKQKGIRSIWADIHTKQVWTVCFDKKGKALTKKAYNAAKEAQVEDFMTKITNGDLSLKEALKQVQEHPVLDVEKGEERKLRGYKIQFSSINGFYDVIDVDILDPENKGVNVRKVNINEIKW